ncbi:Hypothetical protein, predicted lipoprotein, predicted membrane nuclease [Mycoplasmopsis bovigenitalium 51080]|uniref:Endonuclease/exonuclease/phosphatase domain-containing protein n=1 Tax=Mycoplasmopsis bovigenitalium 51080 TaxID=1188235 RepID=N9TUI4_9BACT|nr:hypothetical protein [Mycoplasmopsis bovigenitalium]ENY69720.1 Hypothetical protein, predicted lipoprotein, predicted membrane nuclease [Mycoplasmopsis bovigenitalium 51080]
MKKIKLILLSSISTIATPIFMSSSCTTSKENNKVANTNNQNDDVNVNSEGNAEIDSQNSNDTNQPTMPDLRAGRPRYNRNHPRRSKRLKDKNQNQETDSNSKKTNSKKKTKKQENKANSTVGNGEIDSKNNSKSQNISNKHKLRIASWNLKNFGDSSLKTPKAKAISSIIYKQGYDVVGLTELDSNKPVKSIIDLLNELESKLGTNNVWKSVVSDEYNTAKGYKSQADKYAAYIYKSNIVEPLVLKNGKRSATYDNSNFENKFKGTVNNYNRPPFLVQFGLRIPEYKKVNFSYLLAHFDGPGQNKHNHEPKYQRKNGAHEMNEAWNIKNVFQWAKKLNNGDDDLIFQGDTNISLGNEKEAFGWIGGSTQMPLKENEQNKSSLSQKINSYSQTFDKIVHQSNLKHENAKVYKLYDFVNDGSYMFENISSLDEWVSYYSQYKRYKTAYNYIYSGVSDHCPISYDLILDANDPK